MTKSVFKQLLATPGFTSICPLVSKEAADSLGDSTAASLKPISKPERLWLVAHADAYRELAVTGEDLDYALSYMLARAERPTEAIATYATLLQSPGLIQKIMTALFPRPGVPVSVPQKYAILEASVVTAEVDKQVKVIMPTASQQDAAVKAYTAAVLGVLVALGLCAPPEQAYVVMRQEERIATVSGLKAFVLQDKIRSALVSSMVASVKAKLPVGFAPQALADRTASVFRGMAEFLDSIKLMERRFRVVEAVMNAYFTRKDDLSLEITLMDEVRDFANHANFLLTLSTEGLRPTAMASLPLAEIRECFVTVRAAIASCVDVREVPLAEYADRFGLHMTYAPGGVRRGAVTFIKPAVEVKMPLVKGTVTPAGTRLRPIPAEYAMSQGIAPSLSKGILSDMAWESLVSMVSDELAREQDGGGKPGLPNFKPVLRGLNVTEADLVLLALSRADTINYRATTADAEETGMLDNLVTLELIYGVPLASAWRMQVLAATPKYGFFSDPASVVIYTAPEAEYSPKPWPMGPQQLKLPAAAEKLFQVLPTPEVTLRKKVTEPFDVKLPYVDGGGKPQLLTLNVKPTYPTITPPKGIDDVFVAAVLEPAASKAVSARVYLALQYTKSSDPTLASKARTWLITSIVPILVTSVMTQITWETLNEALIEAKIDGRMLQAQMVDLHMGASFGIAMAILHRYGLLKLDVDGDVVRQIIDAVPPANMSPIAAVLRAQLAESASRLPA